jgi:glycosyltransferase involved in cell wall biosynthesis
MKRLKVAHLTSAHMPTDTRIFHKECKTLVAAGYDVVLIVQGEQPTVMDGVRLRPVPRPAGRGERFVRTTWHVLRAALDEDADIYHFHDPELLPVGFLLKARGKRVVYDVHEDVPRQILTKAWIPGLFRQLAGLAMEAAETAGAASFDGLVTATPAIARRFPEAKTITANNFPFKRELAPPEAGSYMDREPLALYTGSITEIRGLHQMLDAMAKLPPGLQARLAVAGMFSPPELQGAAARHPAWRHVEFHGWVSREGLRDLSARARLGLVLFHPVPNHVESQPNKLFEYMAAGLPVVASDFPLWRELIGRSGCGLLVDPLDSEAIAGAIEWLLTHPDEAMAMGQRGQEAVLTTFNWESEAGKLLRFYDRLAA